MPVAFSYLRFSTPQQWAGDSLRRQAQARQDWLVAHPGVQLDRSLVMTDAGRSAFKRKNWDNYALARFVECIKSGQVKPGSFLLVENLDRLSREDAGEATELFLSIVNKGVVIVQLSPVVMEFRKPVNMQQLMFAVVELSRGHSESAIKSERGRGWWGRKQREAATKLVTRRVPGWMQRDDEGRTVLDAQGRPVLDPVRAKVVRRMFKMARDGHGATGIADTLNREGVPVFGKTEVAVRGQSDRPPAEREKRTVAWSGSLVWYFLRSRATMGEYVPYRRRGDEAGSPVPDYFPCVVTPETFHAVQGAIAARKKVGRGRRGKHINLFAGLLRDARDGGTLSYWRPKPHLTVLVSVNAKEQKTLPWVTFPAETFDAAILSKLAEVKAADIQTDDEAVQRLEVITGRLAEADALIKLWTAKMDNPAIVDTVAAKLADLNTERKKLAAEQAAAQQEAASPLAESWGEFRSLADLLKKDRSDDIRMKVRAALRRSIESVYCLFVARGATRVCAAQIWLAGGAHRDYLIMHQWATRGAVIKGPGKWWAKSLAEVAPGGLDLRRPANAHKLEKALVAANLDDLA